MENGLRPARKAPKKARTSFEAGRIRFVRDEIDRVIISIRRSNKSRATNTQSVVCTSGRRLCLRSDCVHPHKMRAGAGAYLVCSRGSPDQTLIRSWFAHTVRTVDKDQSRRRHVVDVKSAGRGAQGTKCRTSTRALKKRVQARCTPASRCLAQNAREVARTLYVHSALLS